LLTEQVGNFIFKATICLQDLNLEVKAPLKKRKKMLKFSRCFILGLGKENPAVIGFVVYEIHKVAVAKAINGSHWALQI
jgi:hypothetical protein